MPRIPLLRASSRSFVSALLTLHSPLAAQVTTGLDALLADDCRAIAGARIGLVTNHTGRTANGERAIDALAGHDGCSLVAIFSPEHGVGGDQDAHVADAVDPATRLPVHSLYGATRKPTAQALAGIDTLVFDIQDIGCRFYTYVSTLRNVLEAAAEHDLRVVVLDRPNPIGGEIVEGPLMPPDRRDFVGAHTVPIRHGMTVGELARMIAGEEGIAVRLEIVPCRGWRRRDRFDATGLTWVSPSPNMRRLTAALTYPGIGLIEGTNVSVGRGTDTPFEVLGAPWCDGRRLAAKLREADLPGVVFVPVEFTPTASRFVGERCSGVHVLVTDWDRFEPVCTGVAVASALLAGFPDDFDPARLDWLLKHPPTLDALRRHVDPQQIAAGWRGAEQLFRLRRRPFLLYE